MPLILSGNVASATAAGYEVANSCRFNDGDSPKLAIDFGSDGTLNKWTFSMWFKRSTLGTAQRLFCCLDTGMDDYIKFGTDDQLEWVFDNEDGTNKGVLKTNRKFRDVGAFYHLVCRLDTTDGTAGDRMRMYINGTEETSFATDTNPAQNETGDVGRDNDHFIGTTGSAQYFDGYIAEVCMINNQSLAPTSFGEFDEDSPTIWKPIDVSGLTVGTSGFYLDFEASDNLGNDAAGGTDWDETNLAATDQSLDSPTNNFCTMNPLDSASDMTFAEGNLKVTSPDATWRSGKGTFAVGAGRWYMECKMTAFGTNADSTPINVGITKSIQDGTTHSSVDAGRAMISSNDIVYENVLASGDQTMDAGDSTGDIIGIYLDLESGTINWYKNGASIGTSPASGTETVLSNGTLFAPANGLYNSTVEWNFGSPTFSISSSVSDDNGYGSFEYSPNISTTKYYALCTKNLAEYG